MLDCFSWFYWTMPKYPSERNISVESLHPQDDGKQKFLVKYAKKFLDRVDIVDAQISGKPILMYFKAGAPLLLA